MINASNYCKSIRHSKDINSIIESAECNAILFDENDNGFVKSLGSQYFHNNVDYIEIIENGVILIELKDLLSQLKDKTADAILQNIFKKYDRSSGTIKECIDSEILITSYYVVIKDNTDIVVLDSLFPMTKIKKKFTLKDNFIICKTNEICNKLSALGTGLCP